jgi:hypothetical protein
MPPSPLVFDTQPAFDLLKFLAGRLTARGVFEDRFGRLKRRFHVDIIGRWVGDELVVEESFIYDDGKTEQRTWRLRATGIGRFTASCPDCIGIARGEMSESGAAMTYDFRLPIKSANVVLNFADRFYPLGENRMLNRAIVSKWGVRVGELTISFEREPDEIAVSKAA